MMKMSSFGSPFKHTYSSCLNVHPKKFQWVHDQRTEFDIEVYMDYDILGGVKSDCKNKFLWMCESKSITPNQNKFVLDNYSELKNFYKKIFVHDYSILNLDDVFCYCPPAANVTWILDKKIHPKKKMISMVSSGKTFCPGHVFRNEKMNKFKNLNYPIDYYGKLFNPFDKKEDVLNDYMFSITIENESYSNYYTEKLMDCFATGTIPVYHGTPEVGKMFNLDGIILLDDSFDINQLNKDLYFSKINAIKDNFKRCLEHIPADDYIFEKIIENI